MGITVKAPAKINLFLQITGRRQDGYHLIDSLAAFADIGDDIEIIPDNDYTLDIKGTFAKHLNGHDNIITRAATLLGDAVGKKLDLNIILQKNLPVASGLGGGSADAAAILRALSGLWRVEQEQLFLYVLAQKLGADVPVCLTGKPAFMGGIGESVHVLNAFPACPIVLVNPGVGVETEAVFKRFRDAFKQPLHRPQGFESIAHLIKYLTPLKNDLEVPAREIAPVIADTLTALKSTQGNMITRMSGSGATCFGLYETMDQAENAAAGLSAAFPSWWVKAGRLQATA